MTRLAGGVEPEIQVWPSYADVAFNIILILLIYLFVQALVVAQTVFGMVEVRREQTELEKQVLAALPADLKNAVTVRPDGTLLRLSFSDRVLFDRAKAELKDEGMRMLASVGTVLRNNARSLRTIQVEGHTDDVPIKTAQFASNWELSSARATSVVRFLQDQARISPQQLSATGYSEYQPTERGGSEASRAHNRRIELVIVYSMENKTGYKKTGKKKTP